MKTFIYIPSLKPLTLKSRMKLGNKIILNPFFDFKAILRNL